MIPLEDEDEKYEKKRKINRRDCWTFTKRMVTSSLVFPRTRFFLEKDFWECFWIEILAFAHNESRTWNQVRSWTQDRR